MKNYNIISYETLSEIPSHSDPYKTIDEIVIALSSRCEMTIEEAKGLSSGIIAFLNLFGLLDWENDSFRLSDQIPHYFVESLKWYFKNNQTLFDNWTRGGTARDIKINNLLEKAPYFLRLIEERRKQLSSDQKIDAGYSRYQPVAEMLIKIIYNHKSYFLHQWDERAQQYQFIGGRLRQLENHLETAKRELDEEIQEHDLVYARDYNLTLLNNPQNTPITLLDVSRSFGALTQYEFWIYSVSFHLPKLKLSVNDKWISYDEMMIGATKDGKRTSDSKFYRAINAMLPGGFEAVPESILHTQIGKVSDFIEMKPKFLWIFSIDIKGLFNYLKKNK